MLKAVGSKQIETIEEWAKKHENLRFDKLLDLPSKNTNTNVLTIIKGGKEGLVKVIYIAKSGRHYEGEFDTNDNPYLLLKFLAANPNKLFTKKDIKELGDVLNPPKGGDNDPDDERRVRDTFTYIRKLIGLRDNKKDDPFVSARGFGLMCDVEIKS